MKKILQVLILFISASVINAQDEQKANQTQSLKELVQSVTENKGSNEEKTRKLVHWVNTNFKWSYTDYQKRTVAEIIERRAGNCAELANVLAALLTEANIPFRWIHEINIQPRSEKRLADAAKLVAEKGNRHSVFGLMHNDHVWLEVRDEKNKSWFPADPAVGVVGIEEWISARMAFAERRKPIVPAVASIVEKMFVPIVVLAKETRSGKPVENRSEYYLIDGFNKFYKKKLSKMPDWKNWGENIKRFLPYGESVFTGGVNLHQHEKEIEQLWQIYEKLRDEAARK